MAPWPDELDVFTIPHSRMKQLVQGYSSELSQTDFSNCAATRSLLHVLNATFAEFQRHERIENELIVRELRQRLVQLREEKEHDMCRCLHSDKRVSTMAALVQEGFEYACEEDAWAERVSYGRRLREALHDFTRSFLPHMEHEEEVFQPMLVKYFDWDELKCIKDRVIEQHLLHTPPPATEPQREPEVEKFTLEEIAEEERADSETIDTIAHHERIPPEIFHKIFSYLSPPDRGRSALVCRSWQTMMKNPATWSALFPTQWARDDWSPYESVPYFPEDDSVRPAPCFRCSSSDVTVCTCPYYSRIPDEDADVDESAEASESMQEVVLEEGERRRNARIAKETRILDGISRHVLPFVGAGICHVSFAGSQVLDGRWLALFLQQCPNLRHLDLSYNTLDDVTISTFKGKLLEESKNGKMNSKLQHLNLSGCLWITDAGFTDLVQCLAGDVETSHGLKSLQLSGCRLLTDITLRFLVGFRWASAFLESLDVSGCPSLGGAALTTLFNACPRLEAANLAYCDRIMDGPQPEEAYGCQNLGASFRFCCSFHSD